MAVNNVVRDFVALADSASNDEIQNAYREMEQGDKARARKSVENEMRNAMSKSDFDTASKWFAISSLLTTETKSAKAEIDPTETLANRILSLEYAAMQLANGNVVPDGIDAEKVDYSALAEMVNGADWDSVAESVTVSGDKLASQKVSRNAARRDVSAHISHVVSNSDKSELLVSEIHNTKSPEYGDDFPSSGAIFASLSAHQKNDTLDTIGVSAFQKNANGKMVAIRA